jgi:hypothetical protein
MVMGNPNWIAGQSGNPNGRPVGSRNKRTQEIIDLIQERGDKDPLDALSDIITTNKDPSIVAQASSILAPYLHSKRGTAPVPRLVDEPIPVPNFQSVAEAEDFLASIAKRSGAGELELQAAQDISNLVRNWIISKNDSTELELKVAAQGGTGRVVVEVIGGMPNLPGTTILMPQLNGRHDIDGVALVTDQTSQPSPAPQEIPMGISEVRSPCSTSRRSSDRPLSPGARSNPSRDDATSVEPSPGEVRTPGKPSHLGDEQPAELHITGPDPNDR